MILSGLLFGKSNVPVATEVIRMTEVRHKELVNNIANMDTPYYKARDINVKEFRSLLGKAIDERKGASPWHFKMQTGRDVQGGKSLNSFHMKSIQDLNDGMVSTGFRRVRRMDDTVMRHDQNNVTPEGEMARLGKNSSLHKTFVTIARDNFSMIETALRMRV
jgi:flagellar basal-body rod protein FlgB